MSILGTGVAAGVAQTNLQAQQQTKKKDRTSNETAKRSREIREVMEVHLRALEEGDDDSVDRIHIDGQVPNHDQQQLKEQSAVEHEIAQQPDTTSENTAGESDSSDDGALYHHVDVQA